MHSSEICQSGQSCIGQWASFAFGLVEPFAELCALALDLRFRTLIDLSLDLDFLLYDPLPPHQADEVMAIMQEALSNVLRHAHAHHADIRAWREQGRLRLTVQDDGTGLPHQTTGVTD